MKNISCRWLVHNVTKVAISLQTCKRLDTYLGSLVAESVSVRLIQK